MRMAIGRFGAYVEDLSFMLCMFFYSVAYYVLFICSKYMSFKRVFDVPIKVPWSRLGQDPVLVYLDRIFLLAEPETQVEGSSEDAVQEAKKRRVQVGYGYVFTGRHCFANRCLRLTNAFSRKWN